MSKKQKKNKKSLIHKDVSIVAEVKEPFSWYRFWDEKVVQNWQNFKQYLDKKGILYLIMSPFRYPTRLIFRLWLIAICVMIGIVPRAYTMVQEAKQQFRSNELVLVQKQVFPSGRFTVSPLLSSHKGNKHIMVFNIYGSSGSGVASTTDAYDVRLVPRQSISKPDEIFFRYQIVAFDSNQRLLVVELDMSRTDNTGGLLDLYINAKGENNMDKPLNLTLSSQQSESPLYDGTVHLSALSSMMSSSATQKNIQKAEEKLNSVLNTYKLEYERLQSMGTEVKVTPEQMNEYAKSKLLLDGVKDDSTTDIVTSEPMKQIETVIPVSNAITIGGNTITDTEYSSGSSETLSKFDKRLVTDMVGVIEMDANIASAVHAVNQARLQKYTELYGMARILSTPINDSAYTPYKSISDSIKETHEQLSQE